MHSVMFPGTFPIRRRISSWRPDPDRGDCRNRASDHKTRWDFANIKDRHSLQWKWYRVHDPGDGLYMKRIIQGNLGFSDKELKKYFNSHRDNFTNTIKSHFWRENMSHDKEFCR